MRKHRKVHIRSSAASSAELPLDNHDTVAEVVRPSCGIKSPAGNEIVDEISITTRINQGPRALDDSGESSLQYPLADINVSGDMSWYNAQSHGEGPFDIDLAWTFDYITAHADDTIHNLTSQQVPYTYGTAGEGHTVNSTSTNETHSEWPDGQSRSTSPLRGQFIPSYSDSRSVDVDEMDRRVQEHSIVYSRQCRMSPETTSILFELVTSELLAGFCCGQQPRPEEFPDTRVLQHFLLLYFVHVHPRFPVAHLPTFSTDYCSPDLLLSMILAGSCHSESNQYTFCHVYIERARTSVTLQRERAGSHVGTFQSMVFDALIENLAENNRPDLYSIPAITYRDMVWTNGSLSPRRDRSRGFDICMQEESFARLSIREAIHPRVRDRLR